MRIVQAVPLISDDNAFGGPVSVALAQSKELIGRGHDVTLMAGWRGDGLPPQSVEGVPADLHRVRQTIRGTGFSGLTAPGLMKAVAKAKPDVAHLHSGRHLITLGIARQLRQRSVPYVVQTHGMLPPNTRLDARILDRTLTSPALASARRVFALTDLETSQLGQQFGKRIQIETLLNGMPLAADAPVIRDEAIPEVLFISRLHERKRPMTLVRAAGQLRDAGTTVRITILGPDEGELPALVAAVAELGLRDTVSIGAAVAHDQVVARMQAATVFALPSVDEPFPMSILEALSAGTPVVCTTSCGLAPLLTEYDAGGVIAPTVDALTGELTRLLRSSPLRQQRVANGTRLMRERLSIEAVVDQLESVY